MQDVRYVADELKAQINSTKPLLITVFAGLVLLLIGLRVLPEESSPLLAKVMGLLCPTLASAGVGAYVGRGLRGWLPAIGLLVLSILGMFILGSLGACVVSLPLLFGWGFIIGMLVGPLVAFAIADAGASVVIVALTGTTAVMMLSGLGVYAIAIGFRFLMPLLFLALMGLIIVGLVGIF